MADHQPTSAPTESVEALLARVAALEAENDALREPNPSSRRGTRSPMRATFASVLIVAGLLAGTVGVVAAYAKQQLLDTTNFVASFALLADDPAVQGVVSDAVVVAIDDAVDIPSLTSDVIDGIRDLGLPPRADAALGLLEAPAAQGLQGLVDSSVDAIVTSDAFSATWEQALLISHTQIMATLHHSDDAALAISDGALHLQIGPLVAEVKERMLENGITLADAIPAVDRSILLVENASLEQIRTATIAVDSAGTWLPWLSLLLLIGGVLVARRRRRTVIVAAVASAVLMGVVGIGISVARGILVRTADRGQSVMTGDALGSFFDAATGVISQMALAILILGVAVALSAWLAGPSSSARRIRVATGATARGARVLGERRGISTGRVGEWADAHHSAMLAAIGVIAAAVILFTRPLSSTVITWTTVGALLALLLLQLVRRPAAAEPAPAALIEQEHDRHA
ncbi:LPXTG cell wall anchor domain-containing protein [Microbacterium sp. AGC85]